MANEAGSLFMLLPLVALLGCGASSIATTRASSFLQLDGNWEAIGKSPTGTAILASPVSAFTGALQSTKGQVSGTLRAVSVGPDLFSPCISLTQDLAATGTLDSANHLTLTAPIAGGTATLSVTLAQDLHAVSNGTYTIVGGPCAMPSTAMSMTQFASLTGTYSGTVTSYPTPGATATLTAVLTQSSKANVDGLFPLSGTITLAGGCAASFSFTNGTVSGNGINTFFPVDPLVTPGVFHGAMAPDGSTIQASIFLYSFLSFPACSINSFAGTLTRQ